MPGRRGGMSGNAGMSGLIGGAGRGRYEISGMKGVIVGAGR
jgi:hypothetical protein